MSFKITIKNTQHEKYDLCVEKETTIASLKNAIMEKDNKDSSNTNLLLIFSGKILKDDMTIGSYDISEGNEVVKLYKENKVKKPEPEPVPIPQQNDQQNNSDNLFEQGENQNDNNQGEYRGQIGGLNINDDNVRNMMFNAAQQRFPDLTQEQFNNAINMINNGNLGGQKIQLNYTEQEKNDVTEIINMGFSEGYVHQCYNACDKNKEQTVNMLFDMGDEARSNLENNNDNMNNQQHDTNNINPVEGNNNNVEYLVNMGFDRELAKRALNQCYGSLDRAVDELLNGNKSI